MENDTQKLIEEQLKTLPTNLRQAIESVAWKSIVQEIGKGNALDTEQIASLERETMFIIYAFEPPEDYIANIAREVQTDEVKAMVIAESVDEKIFKTIALKVEELEKQKSSTNEPIIITKDTKEDAMKELNRRSEEIQKMQAPLVAPKADMHPMIEPNEKVHEVTHASKPQTASVPDYRYPKGKDPYREPLN